MGCGCDSSRRGVHLRCAHFPRVGTAIKAQTCDARFIVKFSGSGSQTDIPMASKGASSTIQAPYPPNDTSAVAFQTSRNGRSNA